MTAPISGLVGTTEVKAGNLVGRGESTLLTTISQIDPIIFRVGVTEADYLRIARRDPVARIGATPRADGIELTLADGTRHPQTGRVETVERAVDPTTGTLGVGVRVSQSPADPAAGAVRPGQSAARDAAGPLLVPQRAVQELQSIYSVAVVDAGGKVAFRTVKVGPRVGSLWVIEKGLKRGERVVVEGLQRIQDGMTVVAKPRRRPRQTARRGQRQLKGRSRPWLASSSTGPSSRW